MKPAVLAIWHRFSEPLEGRCYHMYLDTKGLVTTGVGNYLPTTGAAIALPWKKPSGELATRNEVAAAYALVSSHQEWAPYGGNHHVWHELTALRLSPEDVDDLVRSHLASDEQHLRAQLPEYDDIPADGQLALHSWAWAVGARAKYPRLFAALRDKDYAQAAVECFVNPNVGTIIERNRRNRVLFTNAERVRNFHFDPDVVYWPDTLDVAVREASTVPEVVNPVSEDDGGVARHEATLDTVEHPFDDE